MTDEVPPSPEGQNFVSSHGKRYKDGKKTLTNTTPFIKPVPTLITPQHLNISAALLHLELNLNMSAGQYALI